MKKYATLFFIQFLTLTGICQTAYKIVNRPSVIRQMNPNDTTGNVKELSRSDGYKTIDWLNLQLLKGDEKQLAEQNETLYKQLEENAKVEIDKRMKPSEREHIENEIKSNEKKLEQLNSREDSLYHNYVIDYLQYKRCNAFMGRARALAFFDIIYNLQGDRFKVLTNTGLSFGKNTGAIYSELLNGNLGLFRVSMGAMLASSSIKDSSASIKEEAYQRLITTGGNTVMSMEYPLLYIHSRNYQYNLISRVLVKGAADLPQFGTTTTNFAGSGSIGAYLYADASLSNNTLRFFADVNINEIYGSETFRQNLDITTPDFHFGQLALGIILGGNIKISFVVATFSSQKNLTNRSVVAGGQFIR